jgi:hypothetical protein
MRLTYKCSRQLNEARDANPRSKSTDDVICQSSDAAHAQLRQIYRRGWTPLPGNRYIMPAFIRTMPYRETPTTNVSAEFLSVALFSGIGLLVSLIAASFGEQGVWFEPIAELARLLLQN